MIRSFMGDENNSASPELNATRTARPTPNYLVILATTLVCLPILAVSQFAALARVDDIDAMLFAYYGRRMLAGQMLYVDLWDNKPPGVFWADAVGLWFSGGEFWGIALVVSLATIGTTVLFFLAARRMFGLHVAAVGTGMAALYINQFYYHVGANRPSTFYVFCELAVVLLYLRSYSNRTFAHRGLFAAGVFAGCAVCFRQTALSAAAAIAVHQLYLWFSGRRTFSNVLLTARSFAAGIIIVLAVVIAILWQTSDLGWAWHGVVASNLGYVTHTGQSHLAPREIFHWSDHRIALGLPMILAAAALIHSVAARFITWKRNRSERTAEQLGGPEGVVVFLVAWLALGVYLALIGPHRAHHYYGTALAPLVMLATYGIWLVMRRGDGLPAPRYHVIVAVLWLVYMAFPVARLQVQSALASHYERFDENAFSRWTPTVTAIETYTAPDDSVYSFRYRPYVFWRTQRPQGQRYLLETLINQWNERAQPLVDEVIADLKNSPPKALIAARSEVANMADPDERTGIDYRDLSDWIRENYEYVADPIHSKVWILKDN